MCWYSQFTLPWFWKLTNICYKALQWFKHSPSLSILYPLGSDQRINPTKLPWPYYFGCFNMKIVVKVWISRKEIIHFYCSFTLLTYAPSPPFLAQISLLPSPYDYNNFPIIPTSCFIIVVSTTVQTSVCGLPLCFSIISVPKGLCCRILTLKLMRSTDNRHQCNVGNPPYPVVVWIESHE